VEGRAGGISKKRVAGGAGGRERKVGRNEGVGRACVGRVPFNPFEASRRVQRSSKLEQ
jgi:hypothetical protein